MVAEVQEVEEVEHLMWMAGTAVVVHCLDNFDLKVEGNFLIENLGYMYSEEDLVVAVDNLVVDLNYHTAQAVVDLLVENFAAQNLKVDSLVD